MTNAFFDEQEEQSAIKAEIVAKYFKPWAEIMLNVPRVARIAYIDLYSGPGRFLDGTESTPLLILKQIIASTKLRTSVETVFNDKDPELLAKLESEVRSLPGFDQLKYEPRFSSSTVEGEYTEEFSRLIDSIPLLSFLDPWGYKGLSRRLIESIVRSFGCEAIFFFNYSRINAAVTNAKVEPLMEAIFGDNHLNNLQRSLPGLEPERRERLIMTELGLVFEEMGAKFLIPFRFQRPSGQLHYICFVSKHRRGYMIMKDIMAGLGIVDSDGVPKFEYFPKTEVTQGKLIFDQDRPYVNLLDDLMRTFSGRRLSVRAVVEEHIVGTPFIKANYKKALLELEGKSAIQCEPVKRPRGTMGDSVFVTFPVTT